MLQSRCQHMHTRTAALGIFVNLTVEQPLADVTALAHHGQKVVLEMLAAVGAVAEVDAMPPSE